MGERGIAVIWGWIAGVLIATVVVLAVVGCNSGFLDPDHPREAQCPQAKALYDAGLLEKARETYEAAVDAGEDCKQGLADVEVAEAKAEEHFGAAGAYAAASKVEPETPEPVGARESARKAVDEYVEGLKLDPFDIVAGAALAIELNKTPPAKDQQDEKLVEPAAQCETAATLGDAGLLTVADVALANGLAAKAQECTDKDKDKDIPASLAGQRETASERLREARGLDDIAAAREKYAEALQANANLAAAKSGLEESLNDESRLDEAGSTVGDVVDEAEKALDWLVPLAVALLVLALVIWIGVRELAARWMPARRRFEALGELPGLSFFYKAAVPAVSIEEFTGKGEGDLEGAHFSTLLAAEMAKQTGREPAFPFDRVSKGREGEEGDVAKLGEALAEVPATKLLGSLVKIASKLFRRRTVKLEGRLVPAADQGAGVLITLESNGLEPANITLWEGAYDPKPGGKGAARWLRLIPAATAWARWQLAAAYAHPEQVKTESWGPDALFKSGQAWQVQDELVRAEALYAKAIERDSGLLPAAHNLSVIEIRNEKYEQAQKRVKALREALGEKEKKLWPTLDTASLYTLTLALAYPEIDKETKKSGDGDLEPAIETACKLVSTLARELEPKKGEDAPAAAATEELKLAEPASVVLLAKLTFRQESPEGREETVRQAIGRGTKKVRALKRSDLRSEVEDLEPWELIHGYVEKQRHVARRTHYNLACYFTTLSEYAGCDERAGCEDRALDSLDAALVGGGLVEWAGKDPALTPLRKARKEGFEKILEAHTAKPHTEGEDSEEDKQADAKKDEHKSVPDQVIAAVRDLLGQ